jgi:hypothetical protein
MSDDATSRYQTDFTLIRGRVGQIDIGVEVTGYHIKATDGSGGHAEASVMDDEGDLHGLSVFRYLVVDTRNWLPSRQVRVAPCWAESIRWDERKVRVDLSQQQIKDAPEYHPDIPINRRFAEILFDYYGRPNYWIGHSTSTAREPSTGGAGSLRLQERRCRRSLRVAIPLIFRVFHAA